MAGVFFLKGLIHYAGINTAWKQKSLKVSLGPTDK